MHYLDQTAYAKLEEKTERLRWGIRETFSRAAIGVHVNGVGSMFNISISDEVVDNYEAYRRADADRFNQVRLELLNRGILIMPRGTGCLTTAVTDDDVDGALEALTSSLAAVKRS
jgi:glutamate-1-semialdehyde 2,1-aminomutase